MQEDLSKKVPTSLSHNDSPYWCPADFDSEVLEMGKDDMEEIKRRAEQNHRTIIEEIRLAYSSWQMAMQEFEFIKSFFKYLTPTEKMLNWKNNTEEELLAMEKVESGDKQIEELFSDKEVEELRKKYLG